MGKWSSLYRNLLLFYSFVLLLSCNNKQEKVLPTLEKLTESVYSSVIVQPDSLYQVYAAVGGILDKNLVEEGDIVTKGTPIAQIINNTPKLNTDNAKLSLNLARENYEGSNTLLKSLRDEINASELQYKNDSINFTRQKNLWQQNIGSKIEYENKKLAYELSKNKLELLKGNYERTETELITKLRQAENNYRSSIINTEDFTVESMIYGTVYALLKNPGEIVGTTGPLAIIGSTNDFVIEMQVDEVDIVKIAINQKVLITLDAYGPKTFEATLSKIYPRKDERSQTFKVEALFNAPPEVLYPGLAGEGNIIISIREKALTIPKSYLVGQDQVKTENGLVKIITGSENMEMVEVLEGLDSNTYIFKPTE